MNALRIFSWPLRWLDQRVDERIALSFEARAARLRAQISEHEASNRAVSLAAEEDAQRTHPSRQPAPQTGDCPSLRPSSRPHSSGPRS